MAELNSTYLGYITSAIRDFDSIFAKLVDKKVAQYGTNKDGSTYNTGIPTSSYANLIGKLYAVKDASNNDVTTITTPTISYLTAPTASTVTLDPSSGVITLSTFGNGYVDANSVISGSLTPVPITFANLEVNDDDTAYVYTAPANTIVKDVSITKGSLEINLDGAEHVQSSMAASFTGVTASTGGFIDGVISVSADSNAATPTGYKSFTITPTMLLDCVHEVTLSKDKGFTFTEGYIESPTLTKTTITLGEDSKNSTISDKSLKVHFKEAKLTNVKAEGSIAFTNTGIAAVSKESDKTSGVNYVEITASASLSVSGTIEAGYIAAGSLASDGANETTSKLYLATSSNEDITKAASLTIDGDTSIASIGNNADSSKYSIKVDVANIQENYTPSAGYMSADDAAFGLTVTGDTKYINIDHGHISATAAPSITNVSGTGFSTSSGDGKTAITVSLSATNSLDGTVQAGYISGSSDYTLAGGTANGTIYVSNQTVTTDTLSINSYRVEIDETAESGYREVAESIFLTDLPTDKPLPDQVGDDFYAIDVESIVKLSAGYTASSVDAGKTDRIYIPKAQLKYIADDEKGNLIEVEAGGYLPAGLLTEISSITGTLDAAVVNVGFTGSGVQTVGTKKVYRIVTSLAAGSSAGYFSNSSFKGGTYDIDIGSVTTSAEIGTSTFTSAVAAGDDKYTITSTVKGNVKTSIVEGYIQGSDLTINGEAGVNATDTEFSGTSTITLDKAILSVLDSNKTVNVTASSSAFDTAETKYAVNVNLGSDKTITVKASDGYILSNESETEITVGAAEETFYIKEGSVGTIAAVSGENKIIIDAGSIATSSTASDDYIIKLQDGSAVSAEATVTEGYVDGGKASGSVAVIADEVHVAHGKVKGVIEASNSIESETVSIYGSQKEAAVAANGSESTGKTFAINAKDNITASVSVVKAGYVVSADTTSTESKTTDTSEKSFYLAGYNGSTTGTGDNQVYIIQNAFVSEGETVSEETIQTAGKYLDKNIKVTLHEDAMGSNVVNELAKLGARLSGSLVSGAGDPTPAV